MIINKLRTKKLLQLQEQINSYQESHGLTAELVDDMLQVRKDGWFVSLISVHPEFWLYLSRKIYHINFVRGLKEEERCWLPNQQELMKVFIETYIKGDR